MTETATLAAPSIPTAPHKKAGDYFPPTFSGDPFLRELRKRVDAYFEKTGYNRRDLVGMYFKTATVLAWFFGAYIVTLLFAHNWYTVVPLAILMGLGLAAIGFNIQHDGSHEGYSEHKWVNRLMALTLDLMGGSSYLWDWKHNSLHHTYTNIAGHDDDIDVGFLARFSPEQPRYWFHRFQNIYLFILYGTIAIKWQLFDDFKQVAKGKIGAKKIPRPRGKDLAVFIGGKALFLTLAFVIPIAMGRPIWAVLCTYALAAFVSGVVMSVVFQLAHVVEEAAFPVPQISENGRPKIMTGWAVHQVQTTADFSRGNPVLSWFLGGLNYQVEHHLFHKVCHLHYPALSKVVEEACKDFGLKYSTHKSFFTALRSHYRWLREMGRPTMA